MKERVLLKDNDDAHSPAVLVKKGKGRGFLSGTIGVFRDIWQNAHRLPVHIRQICLIQFFSWIGWFPVLFFSTVWVGEIYTLSLPEDALANATDEGDKSSVTEEATLRGFRALLYSSLLGLATIIILPLIVSASKKASKRTGRKGSGINLAELWCFSLLLFALCMFATVFTSTSVKGSTLIIATTGFCFAVSQWIPFSLLAEEIRRGSDDANGSGRGEGENGYEQVAGEEGRDPESIPLHLTHHDHDDEDRPQTAGLVFDAGEIVTARTGDADERTLVGGNENDRNRQGQDRQRTDEERELMKDLETTEYGMESPFVGGSIQSGSGNGIELESGRDKHAKENIGDKAGIILVSELPFCFCPRPNVAI